MKKLIKVFLAALLMSCMFMITACDEAGWYYDYSDSEAGYNTKLFYQNDSAIRGADPYVIVADGYYYMYVTGNTYIPGFRSKNLTDWQELGAVFTPSRDAWSVHNLWAPEVVEKDGKFYMYYSGRNATTAKMGMGVAVADDPAGPFVEIDTTEAGGDIDASVMPFDFGFPIIDANVFIDDDGKIYMYFSKDQVDRISRICVVELEDDMVTVKPDTLKEDIIEPDQPWENPTSLPRWNEAPEMLKHNEKYYLMYSANYFQSRFYSVGVAVSSSPTEGFEKVSYNPILGVDVDWEFTSGTGHNCWFKSMDNEEYIVAYHSHANVQEGTERVINFDRLTFDGDRLIINGPTISPQPLPSGASEYSNIASEASVTVNGQEQTMLTDDIINFNWRTGDLYEFQVEKTAKIVLTFDREVDVTAIMIYDSADYELTLEKIDKIDFGAKKINNLNINPAMRYVDDYDFEIKIPGSAFMAEFEAFKTDKITITVNPGRAFALSEIVVLGK